MNPDLRSFIRTVPDFPNPPVQFLDVSPLLGSADALRLALSQLSEQVNWSEIDVIIGIESRGFIFCSALAAINNKGFAACRKAGKLPGPVIAEKYDLEYGSATIEMQPGSGRALIVDDVLATGGTLTAAIIVAEKSGYQVQDVLVLIDITTLNQMKFKNAKIKSLLQY